MTATLRLGRVLVFAPDLRAAREFYGEALGLRLAPEQDGFLRFHGDDFELDVFECESAATAEAYSRRAGSAVAFSVSSVDDAMKELHGKGVRFLHEQPNRAPDGTRYVAFVDPFGTVFELIETGDTERARGRRARSE